MPLDPSIVLGARPVHAPDPLETVSRIMALKTALQQQAHQQRMMPLQEQAAQEGLRATQRANEQNERKVRSQQVIRDTFLKANGDPTAHVKLAAEAGADADELTSLQQHYSTMAKTAAEADEKQLGVMAKRNEMLLPLHDQALQLAQSNPQQFAQVWPRIFQQAAAIDPATAKAFSPDQPPTAEQILASKNLHVTQDYVLKQAAEKRAAEKHASDQAKAVAELPGIQAESDIKATQAKALKDMTLADWQAALDSTVPDKKSPLYERTYGAVQLALRRGDLKGAQDAIRAAGEQLGRTETAVATAKATAPIKIDVANATAGAAANVAAAGGGLDMMAEQALSGQFNSRNPQLMAKVYNRAAELANERGMNAQGALMAKNAAHAAQGALNAVTKQYETLKPFAEMAEKNAGVLEQKSKEISNLGAPFLNMPLRAIQGRFAGDPRVSAFIAALQPVQADFARLLNSPTGGGVLSDDSRHEMQKAISPDATPQQIKAALEVFRQDAKNRKEAYEASLVDLKGRTVVGGQQQPKATHRFNPATGRIEAIQ